MAVTLFRRKPQPLKAGLWPSYLGKPIDPMETTLAARALSVLHSMDVRDPRGLTKDEAIAVLLWNGQPV